eukprot:UN25623
MAETFTNRDTIQYTWNQPIQYYDENTENWLNAFIIIPQKDESSYTIKIFETDEIIPNVGVENIRHLSVYSIGTEIEFQMCSWKPAQVVSINADGTYDIFMIDGQYNEFNVPGSSLRASSSRFDVLDNIYYQDKVSGNHYQGVILQTTSKRNEYDIIILENGTIKKNIHYTDISETINDIENNSNEQTSVITCEDDSEINCLGIIDTDVYDCNTDLKTISPDRYKSGLVRDACPIACGLCDPERNIFIYDKVLLDGLDQGIVYYIDSIDGRYTIELIETGEIITSIIPDRLQFLEQYFVNDIVDYKQCHWYKP